MSQSLHAPGTQAAQGLAVAHDPRVMPAIALASYGLTRLLERPLPEPDVPDAAIPAYFVLFFVLAVGEEAGWSGYAIDPLQDRWGP